MIQEVMGLDEKDVKIIGWYMENPLISQQEIAQQLKLSQPSVNSRIQKLMKKGVLNFRAGLEFTKSKLVMVRVDFTAKDAHVMLEKLKRCAFFVNGFVMSGKHNVSVFLVCDDIRKMEDIINEHIRSNQQASDINVNVVVDSARDFLFQIDVKQELQEKGCFQPNACKECGRMGLIQIEKTESSSSNTR